jgi:DNA polymerase III epsilon subunit-like protein
MRFLFLDIEATGILISGSEVLTIGAIKTDRELNIVDQKLFELRPLSWLPRYDSSVHIHGITKEESSSFPEKKSELLNFLKWVKDPHYFICHANKIHGYSYDYSLIQQEMLDINMLYDFRKLLGTKSLSTHFISKTFLSNGLIGKHKEKLPLSLKDLCDYFGIDMGEHHSALDDARSCLEIARRLKDIDEKFFYRCIEGYLDLWEAFNE